MPNLDSYQLMFRVIENKKIICERLITIGTRKHCMDILQEYDNVFKLLEDTNQITNEQYKNFINNWYTEEYN